ncbi:MAG: FtsX-like permease family protein [Ekhidna sp.]|uniref:ABC transporter permease n=1 Tax=Ekhidna sp. TaxID=2608089 RepID=UPI0032EF86C4
MLKNFIITSFRTFSRNKTYFGLGLLGLSLGISCVISIYAIVNFQSNYDTHQKDGDQIFRIVGDYHIGDDQGTTATVPHPLANGIREELSNVVAISNLYMLNDQVNIPLPNDNIKKIRQERMGFIQEDALDILTFEWTVGGPESFGPDNAFISESVASKFFDVKSDYESVIGRTIIIGNKHSLQVAGVYKDFPKKTDFPFEMIASYEKQEGLNPYFGPEVWGRLNGGTQCLLKIQDNVDPILVQQNVNAAFEKHNVVDGYTLRLQPLAQIHKEPAGNYSGIVFEDNYRILSYTLAVFLAIIGAINFINLSTARAIKRAKEVGIRKVMGSQRLELVLQFMMESLVIVTFSLFIGFGLADQILSLFEHIGFSISLTDVAVSDWVIFSAVVIIGMTIFSGLYPAMVLSRFSPINAIKTKVSNIDRQSKVPLRKLLVGVQFGFSILLIISAMVIFLQMKYMKDYDMGFKSDDIISMTFPEPDFEKQHRLQMLMEAEPEISASSLNLGSPVARTNNTDKYYNPEVSKEEMVTINTKSIDEKYLDLFDIKLISGRNVTTQDTYENVLVTKITLEKLKLGDPHEALGKTIEAGWGGKFKIVGVVEDFMTRSLDNEQTPVILFYSKSGFYELALSISNTGKKDMQATLKKIESIWDQVYPNLLIQYDFLDEEIKNRYKFQDVIGKSTTFFVIIALIISVLGLYGLTDYMANAKKKEIGIRKVVGAEVIQIIRIFLKEVVVILIVAFLIASSVGYWLMNQWLNGFEYRITFGWEILVAALASILLIALSTMGYRSYKAATINPVDVLKDE